MSDTQVSTKPIKAVGDILNDAKRPLAERFRALFTLRNLGGFEAVESIAQCFSDPSALLKHECAYCLGQMQNQLAVPFLIQVLQNVQQEAMVRHEAGEALGAIGSKEVLDILQKYSSDPVIEVAETCQLAVERIQWLASSAKEDEALPDGSYTSVDPAPACQEKDVATLKQQLLDEDLPLFKRYRAMFALRNIGTTESVEALAAGLRCRSALFRHEVAYVLGQMQHPAGVEQLVHNLRDEAENGMVRHECAEALGAIATPQCMAVLQQYLKDEERVVKESCEVALDMCDYQHSDQFQYADGLDRVAETEAVQS